MVRPGHCPSTGRTSISEEVLIALRGAAIGAESGLPPNWEVRHSNSKGLPYYFNSVDRVSYWDPPQGTDTEKLKAYMAANHGVASHPSAVPGAPEGKIRAAHLLVKHKDSRRPSSWREAEITRTKDEAMEIIQAHEQMIKSGKATLRDLASSESDCSSASKRGDLGYFGRGDMQQQFEEAAFALQPGEISGVVQSDSGLHLIERYITEHHYEARRGERKADMRIRLE
ncbi:protein kinase ssp1 [Claviceps sp. LM458 group G5]|nr:protein kinase ssp1 [Claviceps sp. LM458 group G5]